MADINRAAAFTEYARGTPLPEIALALAIPEDRLRRWAHDEDWPALVPTLVRKVTPLKDFIRQQKQKAK